MFFKALIIFLLALLNFILTSTQSLRNLRESQSNAIESATSSLMLSSVSSSTTTSSYFINRRRSQPTATTISPTPVSTGGSNVRPSRTYCGWAACPPPTSTTAPHPPVPTKVDPKCNVAGYPSEIFKERFHFSSVSVPNIVSCQSACFMLPQCWSYAYQAAIGLGTLNCMLYTGIFDARNLFVIPDEESPLRFSDKYPQDGSNFCYGSKAL